MTASKASSPRLAIGQAAIHPLQQIELPPLTGRREALVLQVAGDDRPPNGLAGFADGRGLAGEQLL